MSRCLFQNDSFRQSSSWRATTLTCPTTWSLSPASSWSSRTVSNEIGSGSVVDFQYEEARSTFVNNCKFFLKWYLQLDTILFCQVVIGQNHLLFRHSKSNLYLSNRLWGYHELFDLFLVKKWNFNIITNGILPLDNKSLELDISHFSSHFFVLKFWNLFPFAFIVLLDKLL